MEFLDCFCSQSETRAVSEVNKKRPNLEALYSVRKLGFNDVNHIMKLCSLLDEWGIRRVEIALQKQISVKVIVLQRCYDLIKKRTVLRM